MWNILAIFVGLRLAQYLATRFLATLNRRYYLNEANQKEAMEKLQISREDMDKALAYGNDKYLFSYFNGWASLTTFLLFLVLGGFGYLESTAYSLAQSVGGGQITIGLFVFAMLGLGMMIFNVPFDIYNTFVIEEKHGFNRQTLKGFIGDRFKGLFIGALLGGGILALLLWIMGRAG